MGKLSLFYKRRLFAMLTAAPMLFWYQKLEPYQGTGIPASLFVF